MVVEIKTKVKDFYTAVEERRSYYSISDEPIISDDRIEEIVKLAVLHTPSAFNSQSARVIVLLHENHKKLWSITKETLRKMVDPEKFVTTEARMDAFGNGYGTILFFEDQEVIQELMEKFPSYKKEMDNFSLQSSGMLQNILWIALESEGFGASLQHYNPLIDDEVKEVWNLPSSWKLIAQMPFGKPTALPNEKQYKPVEDRIRVIK